MTPHDSGLTLLWAKMSIQSDCCSNDSQLSDSISRFLNSFCDIGVFVLNIVSSPIMSRVWITSVSLIFWTVSNLQKLKILWCDLGNNDFNDLVVIHKQFCMFFVHFGEKTEEQFWKKNSIEILFVVVNNKFFLMKDNFMSVWFTSFMFKQGSNR